MRAVFAAANVLMTRLDVLAHQHAEQFVRWVRPTVEQLAEVEVAP